MAKDAPELYLLYKDAQDVYEARNRQLEGGEGEDAAEEVEESEEVSVCGCWVWC